MLMSAAFLASALTQFVLGLVVAWMLGPAEFGAYALALAAAVLIQTGAFEWIRLAATRFHHADEGDRLASRLGRVLGMTAFPMLALAGLAFMTGVGGRGPLFALVPLIAAAAGYADFRAALMRAEFEQGRYAAFLLARNMVAALLLPLAAWRFGHAEAVLGAFLAALVVATVAIEIIARRRRVVAVAEENAPAPAPATPDLLRYAGPIVATNILYLALFFGLRALIAWHAGLAVAGQVSLALDFVLKLFSTVGTALDLLLFQLAVRDDREQGVEAGGRRLAGNAEIMLATVLPMAAGLALVAGDIEPWLVSSDYRGAFSVFVIALLPGIALYTLIQYALHPGFQLKGRTQPLIAAGAMALGLTTAALFVVPRLGLGHAATVGVALAAGMLAAAVWLARRLGGAGLPDVGAFARTLGAAAFMAGTVWLSSKVTAGKLTTGAAAAGTTIASPYAALALILVGIVAYGAASYALDVAGLRGRLARRR
jgi:O-antigen/teichoic acid export membrane protein